MHPIVGNKRKESIVPDDVDTPANDELSLGSSRSLSLSLAKNIRANSRERPRIALPSTISLVAHPAGQEEKQTRGRTSQTESSGMRRYCP